jgi:hypothetical protein
MYLDFCEGCVIRFQCRKGKNREGCVSKIRTIGQRKLVVVSVVDDEMASGFSYRSFYADEMRFVEVTDYVGELS